MRNNNISIHIKMIITLIGAVIVMTVTTGWVLSQLWEWFMVPIFGLPGLSLVQAIGVGITVNFLTKSPSNTKVENIKDILKAFFTAIIHLLIIISLGWIVAGFI